MLFITSNILKKERSISILFALCSIAQLKLKSWKGRQNLRSSKRDSNFANLP